MPEPGPWGHAPPPHSTVPWPRRKGSWTQPPPHSSHLAAPGPPDLVSDGCQQVARQYRGQSRGPPPCGPGHPSPPCACGGPRPVQVTATPWAVPWKHVLPLIVQPCQAGGVSNFLGAVTHNTVTLENVANIFRKDKIPCICPHPGSFYFHCTQATCPGKTPLANPFLQHSSAPTLRPQARPATSPLPTCSPRASPAHVRGRL